MFTARRTARREASAEKRDRQVLARALAFIAGTACVCRSEPYNPPHGPGCDECDMIRGQSRWITCERCLLVKALEERLA